MKNVSWQDVVKLGESNPIIQKHLVEAHWATGQVTQAAALLAMVDALDTRCAQIEVEARRYRYLRNESAWDVRVKHRNGAWIFGENLDQQIDEELAKLAKKAESGGGKVASEDAGS